LSEDGSAGSSLSAVTFMTIDYLEKLLETCILYSFSVFDVMIAV
jgi:hypothetical protein